MTRNFRRAPHRRIARAPVRRAPAFRRPRPFRHVAVTPRDRRIWADRARWRRLLTWGEGVQTIAAPPDPYEFFGPTTSSATYYTESAPVTREWWDWLSNTTNGDWRRETTSGAPGRWV